MPGATWPGTVASGSVIAGYGRTNSYVSLVDPPSSFTLPPAVLSASNISARAEPSRARATPLAMLLVALVAAAPYLTTIGYGFVYDDGPIIANNPALHTPAGLVTAWRVAYWPAAWGSAPRCTR